MKRMHIRLLFEHYRQTLLISEKHKAWFRSRSIEISDDIILRFQLGFADNSIGKKISREYGQQSEYFRGNMQQLGLYKSTGYPFFHGDIVYRSAVRVGQSRLHMDAG